MHACVCLQVVGPVSSALFIVTSGSTACSSDDSGMGGARRAMLDSPATCGQKAQEMMVFVSEHYYLYICIYIIYIQVRLHACTKMSVRNGGRLFASLNIMAPMWRDHEVIGVHFIQLNRTEASKSMHYGRRGAGDVRA